MRNSEKLKITMKRITLIFIFLPLILFAQNKKSSFLIIYPETIVVPENLKAEKLEYLNYEKNRSLENSNGKISKRLKKEIEELTVEKIIGNISMQAIQFFLYENFPQNDYYVAERYSNTEAKERKKADYLVEFNNLIISENNDREYNLSFELVLFDLKKNEYLIKNEFTADETSQGGMFGCSFSGFNCLINNTIRIGTEEIAKKFFEE